MTVKTEHSFLREGKTSWLSPCIDDCEMTVQVLFIFSFRSSWEKLSPTRFSTDEVLTWSPEETQQMVDS